jgi:hypothetical protein
MTRRPARPPRRGEAFRFRRIIPWLALLALAVVASASDLAPDCAAVPGWTPRGEPRAFEPDNLFDYMNGNAEGYIIYGFRKMTGVTCVSGDKQVNIDFSEMESPELAYGIFAANRHPSFEAAAVGAAGQVMPRKATFVKGKYYVEVAANADMQADLEAWVKALEPKVPGGRELPAALGWFPKEGLEADSVRLVPQSVLGLRMLKRGWVAKYADGRAFLVPEESAESAGAVLAGFRTRLSDSADAGAGDESVKGMDRYLGSMCVVRKGRFLAGFATNEKGVDAKARAAALAEQVR